MLTSLIFWKKFLSFRLRQCLHFFCFWRNAKNRRVQTLLKKALDSREADFSMTLSIVFPYLKPESLRNERGSKTQEPKNREMALPHDLFDLPAPWRRGRERWSPQNPFRISNDKSKRKPRRRVCQLRRQGERKYAR